MHEKRETFKPQDYSQLDYEDSDESNLVLLPMPDTHVTRSPRPFV